MKLEIHEESQDPMWHRWVIAVASLLALAGLTVIWTPPSALAAGEDQARSASAESLDSPRASLDRFLRDCRAGDYEAAARFLQVDEDGAKLARRLKAVIDRGGWIDLDRISDAQHGAVDDGLPPDTDEVAAFDVESAGRASIKVVRAVDDGGAKWVFTERTVARIDAWFEVLPDRFAIEHLPEVLLRPGWLELLWWQWIAAPLLVLLAAMGGRLLGWITHAVVRRLASRTKTEWDDVLLDRLKRPVVVGWAVALVYFALPLLALYAPAQLAVQHALGAFAIVIAAWASWRLVSVAASFASTTPWAASRPASKALVPLASRAASVAILALSVILVLSYLGFPVASLIAGLGVGGLALALAAQKTVENLFGAFSIGLDQPIREGDFVRVDDAVGTVEAIGLRSTRIRTLDRTVVSLPNGKLADMRLESSSARDRIRLACTIGLVYETSRAQMRTVLEGLERVLRDHPKIWPDAVVVRFSAFGASSLDIEIMAWFQTAEWSEFQEIRQEVLLSFMAVVEEAGSGFAFPTRTVHLVADARGAPADAAT